MTALAALIVAPAAAVAPAHAVAGDPASTDQFTFTAKLVIGDHDRGCSGALVTPQWIVTATSCFTDDPVRWSAVPAGKPAKHVTATIGRTDLTTSAGHVREVVELVPRADRDLTLARLAKPILNVAPVKVASTAPAANETLQVAGYGRTTIEWAPEVMHTGLFTVDTVAATEIGITGQSGAAVCAGDAGGPAIRVTNGEAELVAVNSLSWQGGCWGVPETETRTGAVDTRVDDLAGWIDATTTAARITDFNCDGAEDIAISDPKATVGGDTGAGLVRVSYGNGEGTAEVTQDLDYVPGGSEAGDRFGETLAVYDNNLDGCSDLVVGIPREDIGGADDTGTVYVLYGSPNGIMEGRGATVLEQGKGSGGIYASAPEAGDQMGYSLAAGRTASGEPYLLIGVPGEKLGDTQDAGQVFYLRGGTNRGVHEGQPGVPGGMKQGERFGASVAASPNHIAIGIPGTTANGNANAGKVQVFEHTLSSDGIPNPLGGFHQSTAGINGGSETGDEFGASLAAVPYRPSGADNASHSIIAIGVPGESHDVDGVDEDEAGRFVTLHVTETGAVSQLGSGGQINVGVAGPAEAGDRFGDTLVAVNSAPGKVSTPDTMLLAVGVPGEDTDGFADAGIVQTFSLLGAAADSDFWIKAGNISGLPGPVGADQRMGDHLTATGTHLYIGMPHGPAPHGALHALPWSNATGGTSEPVTSYEPGKNGFPAAGTAFGATSQ